MKYTHLQLTQLILSSMDSDEVSSYDDTVESLQVANILRTVYYDIVDRAELPEHEQIINLTASTDADKPVLMTVPESVTSVLWVKYNKETEDDTDIAVRPVQYLMLPDFLERMYYFSESDDNVDTFSHTLNAQTFTILYKNDVAPSYYTSIDDDLLLFDSYDSAVDSTLQSSKTVAFGRVAPTYTLSNTFTPDLDDNQFSLLINEAKALAWAELKQTQHGKAEQSARRGWISLQTKKARGKREDWYAMLPNYGRK